MDYGIENRQHSDISTISEISGVSEISEPIMIPKTGCLFALNIGLGQYLKPRFLY